MKQMKILLSSFIAAAVLSCTVPALAEDTITVLVDDAAVVSDVPAQLINDRAMLPFRAILEKLGADVDWNGDYQIVTAVKGKTILNLRIDKPIMVRIDLETQEAEQISLDVSPQIIADRAMVPVRAISEALDAAVDWDQETQTVRIDTQEGQ